MAAKFLQHAHDLEHAQHSPISAREAAVSAAAGTTSSKVAILYSGANHHLWPYYKAFILYNRVYNQYISLPDDSKIRIMAKEPSPLKWGTRR